MDYGIGQPIPPICKRALTSPDTRPLPDELNLALLHGSVTPANVRDVPSTFQYGSECAR